MAANWIAKRPVVVAPMAGGVSTPRLVLAAARAGALGFLAGGYKSAAALGAQIDEVAAGTSAPFGVNVFVPGGPAADQAALAAYLGSLSGDLTALAASAGDPVWDDDDWEAKIAHLTSHPVPVVSFTFGCPPASVADALRRAGSEVWVTVTDPVEAGLACDADCLVVQGSEAGAHRGTFANDPGGLPAGAGVGADLPTLDLLGAVREVTGTPLIAAGGIMTAEAVDAAIEAGALAAQCGTAFLRSEESGAHPAHKAALVDDTFESTAVTRAFSGRPARGLVNAFMRDHAGAPAAYPEINNATKPLRAAAAAAGDVQRMSLWAGAGYRLAADRPAGDIVRSLCGDL